MSNYREDAASEHESDQDHFEELEDGAGCTEIWEHLSEQRVAPSADD